MRNSGKIFFSFLFLLSFLIPTVGETLHQLSHANDLHCNETSVHHFHEAEHHCAICDFSFTSYYSDIFKPELEAPGFFEIKYGAAALQSFYIEKISGVVLRGPPTIC